MATAARDRLARTLRGDAQAAFSVELTTKTDDLSLQVEGFRATSSFRLLLSTKARKLLGHRSGRPAALARRATRSRH